MKCSQAGWMDACTAGRLTQSPTIAKSLLCICVTLSKKGSIVSLQWRGTRIYRRMPGRYCQQEKGTFEYQSIK